MNPASYSPILYEYLRRYQENPRSRVFAPLAEAYRKAGLPEQALEIAREGLRVHPHFVGGRVALGRALFDLRRHAEVVQELSVVVRDVPDNLAAQRLLAESCLILGRVAEALDAYKMLLYFAPGDAQLAKLVQELETQAYAQGNLVLQLDSPEKAGSSFEFQEAGRALASDPARAKNEWLRRVELLQGMLQRVERYRARASG